MDSALVAQLNAATLTVTNLNAERARWAAMTSLILSTSLYPSDMVRMGASCRAFSGGQCAEILKSVLAQVDAEIAKATVSIQSVMTALTVPPVVKK